ncbi:MAG: hypothetical protein WAL92_01960, partial [Thiogranum sp.]
MPRLSAILALFLVTSLARAGDIQQLLQLIDYVGVDYGEAVADGAVVNAGEYAEMQDFAAGIVQQSRDLPDNAARARVQQQADELARQVAARASPQRISTLTTAMRLAVVDGYKVTVIPRKLPDLARA